MPVHLLKKTTDPVELQAVVDALHTRGIECRVENAGMRALLPLPDVMDARVLVHDRDRIAAEQVLRDLQANASDP